MRIRLVAIALLLAAPAGAQSVPDDTRTRFRELTACIERSLPGHDDRISSAEVVARALVLVCQGLTPESRNPDPAALIDALQDAALISVLRARVRQTGSLALESAGGDSGGARGANAAPEPQRARRSDTARRRPPTSRKRRS